MPAILHSTQSWKLLNLIVAPSYAQLPLSADAAYVIIEAIKLLWVFAFMAHIVTLWLSKCLSLIISCMYTSKYFSTRSPSTSTSTILTNKILFDSRFPFRINATHYVSKIDDLIFSDLKTIWITLFNCFQCPSLCFILPKRCRHPKEEPEASKS